MHTMHTVRIRQNGIVTFHDEDGRLHRSNGPAIIRPDGDNGWCFQGIVYTENDYWKIVNRQ